MAGGATATTTSAGLAAGVWTHVAVSVTGTTATFYVNGVAVSDDGTALTGGADNTDDTVWIGAATLDGSTPVGGFTGLIDEVVWWNAGKSAVDIATVYTGQLAGGTTNVVGQWGFDDGGGTIAVDFFDSDQNATLNGNATFSNESAPVQPNSPLELYGSEDTNMTIQLGGVDPESDSLTITVQLGPVVGTLYQTPDGSSLGAAISNGDTVTNASGLVIYVPVANDDGADTDAFSFRLDDGNSAVVDQTVDISLQSVYDDAVLGVTATPVSYNDGDGVVILDATATLGDVDNFELDTQNLGGTLTVSITANNTADDRLTIKNVGNGAGQIGVSGSNISYAGTLIGTFTGGTGVAALVITLNADASLAAVQALARNIEFENVGSAESGSKTITFTLEESDGDSSVTTDAVTVGMNPVSTATFDGDTDSDWFTAANWDTDVVPGATTDTTIGAGFSVVFDDPSNGTVTVKDLALTGTGILSIVADTLASSGSVTMASGTQLLIQSGGTFEVNGTLVNSSGGSIEVGTLAGTSGNLNGSGILDNSGLITGHGGAIGVSTLNNNSGGLISIESTSAGTFAITSTFVNNTGAILRVTGNATNAGDLVFGSDFINDGTVELTTNGTSGVSKLETSSGTTTNNGTFNFSAGAGGTRELLGSYNNSASGIFNINEDTSFDGSITNAGDININQNLTVTGSTTLGHDSGGTIVIAASKFLTINTTSVLSLNGGTITASAGATLDIFGASSLQMNAAGSIPTNLTVYLGTDVGTDGDITGSSLLTIATGAIVNAFQGDASAPITISSGGVFNVNSGSANAYDFNGVLTVDSGGFFNIKATDSSASDARANLAAGGSVAGKITLDAAASSDHAELNVSAGQTLTVTGVIEASGTPSGPHEIIGDVDFNGSSFLDTQIEVTLGGSGTNVSFNDTSTLSLSPGSTLLVNDSATLNFNGGAVAAASASQINVQTGTIDVDVATTFGSDLTTTLGNFSSVIGDITGAGTLTVQGIMNANRGEISAPIIIDGSSAQFLIHGTSVFTVSNTMDVTANATVQILGSANTGTLNATGTITNAGTIQLTSESANSAGLTLTGGGIVNNTGVIEVLSGSGGTRIFTGGNINNDSGGAVNFNVATTITGTTISNNTGADLSIAASTTLKLQTSAILTLNGGTVTAGTSSVLDVDDATLDVDAATTLGSNLSVFVGSSASDIGNITGTNTLTIQGSMLFERGTISSTGSIEIDSGALFYSTSGSSVAHLNSATTINAGGTFEIRSVSSSDANLDVNATITNAGTILLTTTSGTGNAELDLAGGVIVNAGTIQTTDGTGGARTFIGDITNNSGGLIDIDDDTTVTSGQITNNVGSTIDIKSSDTLLLNNSTLVHNSGTIGGAGTLSLTGSSGANTLTLNGDLTLSTLSLIVGTSGGVVGNVDGASTLTVQNAVVFERGVISAPLTIDSGGSVVTTTTGVTDITGTVTINSGGTLEVQSLSGSTAELDVTATITNAGTVKLTGPSGGGLVTLDLQSGGSITNTGTVLSVAGTGGRVFSTASIINNSGGMVDINADTTYASGTITNNSGSSIDVAASTTLLLNASTIIYNGGTIGGAGTLSLTGGVTNTLTLNSNLTLSTLSVVLGTASVTANVGGASTLTVQNTMSFDRGAISAPLVIDNAGTVVTTTSGVTDITGGLTVNSGGALEVRTVSGASAELDVTTVILNNGTIQLTTQTGNGLATLDIQSGGGITNNGTIHAVTGGGTRAIGGGTINNESGGLIDIDESTSISGDINNKSGGIINIDDALSYSSGTLTNDVGGNINIASNATLSITVGNGFDNSGALTVTGATLLIDGAVSNAAGATMTFTGTGSTSSTFDLDVSMTNAGTITLTSGSASATSTLDIESGDTLTNNGIVAFAGTAGLDRAINGGNVINSAAGTIDVDVNTTIDVGASSTFDNAGDVDVASAITLQFTGTNTAADTIDNQTGGTITVNSTGVIDTNGLDITNAGTITVNGTLQTEGGDITNNSGGVLNGSGSVTLGGGSYIDGGGSNTFGLSPGSFTFEDGSVVFSAATYSEFELGGLIAGDEYDELTVNNGLFTLAGTLDVVSYDDFEASAGDSFQIMNWDDRAGMFHEVEGLDNWGSVALDTIVTDSSLTLVARTVTQQGDDSTEVFTGTSSDDVVVALGGDDILIGAGGDDLLLGGEGDDVLSGGTGDDRIIGGLGTDTADYSDASSGVTINLDNGEGLDGEGGIDTLISIENLIGSANDDVLIGSGRDNVFIGGAGADTFVLNAAEQGNDSIQDFISGEDSIVLGAAFGFDEGTAQNGVNFSVIGGGYDGTNAGSNNAHANGNASLVYSEADNALYYDENGKDADGYSVVATLTPGSAIVADDIHFAA